MPVIRVENVGKKYTIGQNGSGSDGLRHAIHNFFTAPIKRSRNGNSNQQSAISTPQSEEFWALKDVSFEVQQGEVVGIIGRNGAGKSTLLKILSRITEPTTGRLGIRGRVASLLEVGTGFHPELTGRENVFLNGAILGMTREEIRRKFDEIVAFAEIEKFIDTPVKRYSSGMYVRLAFAVAAHLEPEILIIDEVLAVGDAQFQKKCLGKMGEVSKEGRTVLFVSHNMTAIKTLCPRSIWLDLGSVIETGDANAIVIKYLQQASTVSLEKAWHDPLTAPGNEKARLHRVRIAPKYSGASQYIELTAPIDIEFEYWNYQPDASLNLSLVLYNAEGACVLNSVSRSEKRPAGLVSGICHIPANLLNDNTYRVRVLVVQDTTVVLLDADNVAAFEIRDTRRDGNWYGKWEGVVRPSLMWTTGMISDQRA